MPPPGALPPSVKLPPGFNLPPGVTMPPGGASMPPRGILTPRMRVSPEGAEPVTMPLYADAAIERNHRMRTMTDSEKRTLRLGTIGLAIYLVVFAGFSVCKKLEKWRTDYGKMALDAEKLRQEIRPYENKVLPPGKVKGNARSIEAFQNHPRGRCQLGYTKGGYDGRRSTRADSRISAAAISQRTRFDATGGHGPAPLDDLISGTFEHARISVVDRQCANRSRSDQAGHDQIEFDDYHIGLRTMEKRGGPPCLSVSIRF